MDKSEENEKREKALKYPLYHHFMTVSMDKNEENEKKTLKSP